MKGVWLLFIVLGLSACSPPKYNQQITCGSFHAEHIFAYTLGSQSAVYVRWPDGRYAAFFNQPCQISGLGK